VAESLRRPRCRTSRKWRSLGSLPSRVHARNFVAVCTLTAGADSDSIELGSTDSGIDVIAELTSLNVLHTFASPGSATLTCQALDAQPTSAGDVRITAIQVSAIS
jgi:hypothetical protein